MLKLYDTHWACMASSAKKRGRLPQRTSRRSNVKPANCGAMVLQGGYRVPPALLSPRATER